MDQFRYSDRAIGIVIAAATVAYLVGAFRIPEFLLGNVPIQSRTFPLGLGAILLVGAVSLIIRNKPVDDGVAQAVTDRSGAEATQAQGHGMADAAEQNVVADVDLHHRVDDPRLEVLILLAAVAAYVAVLEPAGFVLSTVVYILAMAWWFSYRRPVVAVIVAVVLAVGSQVGLGRYLGVRLPSGLLAPFGL